MPKKDDTIDWFGNPLPWAQVLENRAYRRKIAARAKFAFAVRSGKLTRPTSCPKCGRSDSRIEGHHADYERPLDVEWLCFRCHRALHQAQKASAR
jgi:hypothetical protein